MKKKVVRRTRKKAVPKRLDAHPDAAGAMEHQVLGPLKYANFVWESLEKHDFGVLGKIPVFIEAALDEGPSQSQIEAFKRIRRRPASVRKAIARGLKKEFEFAELDCHERRRFPFRKQDEVWRYAQPLSVLITDRKNIIELEIRVDWDHHSCVATIEHGEVKSVVVP